jgi:optic atrophy protein 1
MYFIKKKTYINTIYFLQKYEEWKDGLPDISWINRMMPTEQQFDDFRTLLISIKGSVFNSIELGL